ncbi:hypothetical protein HOC13_04815 [Candidatus Woesearchaeota archaeon]|jgi:hypothetical protein|nr:hypothetical protein [Candidatus Woesearchaeota archaeon]
MTELKDLSPEERIEKLKELEKKKKKEIEEARELLRESEEELRSEEEFKEKVPIPQVAIEGSEGLSKSEKEILELQKGRKEESGEEESLEEAVAREKIEGIPEGITPDYVARLSQEPTQNIYQEMKNIYSAFDEKGYVSSEEERRVGYLGSAIDRKLEDIQAGRYSLTEEVAQAALLTQQIGSALRDVYKRHKEGEGKMYQA